MRATDVIMALQVYADEKQAAILSRFFKTGKGEYGEGDRFMGVRVPQTRIVAKEAFELSLAEVAVLLSDPIHEVRLCGFLILVRKYEKTRDEALRREIVSFYLAHARQANNWDLVDLSAPKILGAWLCSQPDRSVLYELAESENLWEQRIAMVSNWRMIREGDFEDTLRLAVRLMNHPHDLIRKAVGWMLREVGKRDREVLICFLDRYATDLSRTSLRYAIEHFPPDLRKWYMEMKSP